MLSDSLREIWTNFGSIRSSTVSLRDSIFNYLEENGRTYHAYNSGSMSRVALTLNLADLELEYNLPNDEAEQERLGIWQFIKYQFFRAIRVQSA